MFKKGNEQNWCLVRWNEYPPKWDTFLTNKLRRSTSSMFIESGSLVQAPWEKGYADAFVVATGIITMYINYQYIVYLVMR
jgi:hypothetical protein